METPIDFTKLAEAYGATGMSTSKPEEVEAIGLWIDQGAKNN